MERWAYHSPLCGNWVSGVPENLRLSLSNQVLRRHGDVFERTARGYYHAHGRSDDTMNLGGIKVNILPTY